MSKERRRSLPLARISALLAHGYAWLCYEDGHYVLMHEVKDLPETPVEIVSPRKTKFTVRDRAFKVFESAGAQISYVEGEMTWQAKQGEKIRYMDGVCPPYMYSIEMRGQEQEFFWGEYISTREISEAFRIENIQPVTVFCCHVCGKPYFCRHVAGRPDVGRPGTADVFFHFFERHPGNAA